MEELNHVTARDHFRSARKRAAMEQFMANLTGGRTKLLAFEEVRTQLHGEVTGDSSLENIPLSAIVGSVGRVDDFTRSFNPRKDEDMARWAGVKDHISKAGMIPIQVFKVGDAYFVHDGHHRVSVSRQLGYDTILANVTEVATRVPLSADDDPEEIICKAHYADFLEQTNLDETRPQADLMMTICGQYRALLAQIESMQFLMDLDPSMGDITLSEAAAAWYDRVYMPLVLLIRRSGLQRHFAGRTETDLYHLVTKHRLEIQKSLEWQVEPTAAAADLARQKSKRPGQVLDRVGGRILDAITPDALEAGPAAGHWRLEREVSQNDQSLFTDILVAGRAVTEDLGLFRHAIRFAQREDARLLGLLIVADEAERDSADAQRVEKGFKKFCRKMGVTGEYAVQSGPFARTVVDRANWADLVVVSPGRHTDPKNRLGGEFRKVLGRSPRPVLAVPEGANSPLDKALLAYDGSPKAEEALFVAAYLASCWDISLVVVSAGDSSARSALDQAREYLEDQGAAAEYVQGSRPAAKLILDTAAERDSNLILMGGFGYRPVLQRLVGSSVHAILSAFDQPVLICR